MSNFLIISSLLCVLPRIAIHTKLIFSDYWMNRKRNVFALGSNDCNGFQPAGFGFSDLVIAKRYSFKIIFNFFLM